jgi:hypothetical protein
MKDPQKPDHISLIGRRILERKVRCRLDTKANGISFGHKRIPLARASMVYLGMSAAMMTGVSPGATGDCTISSLVRILKRRIQSMRQNR